MERLNKFFNLTLRYVLEPGSMGFGAPDYLGCRCCRVGVLVGERISDPIKGRFQNNRRTEQCL